MLLARLLSVLLHISNSKYEKDYLKRKEVIVKHYKNIPKAK